MKTIVWWLGYCLLSLAAVFFVCYGISLFRAAYELDDPFNFIMMIFASNLIILINGTLLIGFVLRMIKAYKLLKNDLKDKVTAAGKATGKAKGQEEVCSLFL